MLYKLAQAYAMAGASDDALRVLAHAIQQDFVCLPYFRSDALLARIRDDARFPQILERARQRQSELRTAFDLR